MAYLTKEERAAKSKADRKKREEGQKKIGSWLEKAGKGATGFVRGMPSKLKSMSDKQKAKNKADREKRKAKREKEAKAHSAKMADRKKATKARVAAADAKAKAAKAAREAKKTDKAKTAKTSKTTKAKTAKTTKAKTTKAKKKTFAERVGGKKIDYSDPAVREKLTKYKKDPDKGRAGIQSLFGGRGKKQKVASTTTPKGEGFGVAFKRARKAYMGGGKEKTFPWRGKEYHTRWKDETPKQQLATRKGKTKGVDDWQRKVAKKYGGGKV